MSQNSSIEWTDSTWNPVTGCNKVSQGCKHCYAERMAKRLNAMGNKRYINGFKVTLHHDLIPLPLRWSKPKLIFVNSMSDLFHKDVPVDFIQSVFGTMVKAKQHIFQILTKRSKRLLEISPYLPWPTNVWMGVSIENQDVLYRIEHLRDVPANVRFLSCEPLIGSIGELNLDGIEWVIVGGESGPGARLMKHEWVEGIRIACQKQNTAFFFKQWGGIHKKASGRILNGRTYDSLPNAAYSHISSRTIFNSINSSA